MPLVQVVLRSRMQSMINNLKNSTLSGYYKVTGCKPWSTGYGSYRNKVIEQSLRSRDIMSAFSGSKRLPEKYCIGVDERVVELPWVLSRVERGRGALLDAGSTLNQEYLLKLDMFLERPTHIYTLAPESTCVRSEYISYLYGDLRDIPIKDNYYETIVSISVIEHVGFDNSIFTSNDKYVEASDSEYKKVLKELWRVLKPGGELLITLPFGKYQKFDAFQQFDTRLLDELKGEVSADAAEETYYIYSDNGWQLASALECSDSEYFEYCMLNREQRESVNLFNKDGAAAARAVVCLRWEKTKN